MQAARIDSYRLGGVFQDLITGNYFEVQAEPDGEEDLIELIGIEDPVIVSMKLRDFRTLERFRTVPKDSLIPATGGGFYIVDDTIVTTTFAPLDTVSNVVYPAAGFWNRGRGKKNQSSPK